jgi:predicted RNase H-like HicB family nuclease
VGTVVQGSRACCAPRPTPNEAVKYVVVIERTATGYSAYAPDVPGCIATGGTREEAEREMRDAIAFHLDGLEAEGLPIRSQAGAGSIGARTATDRKLADTNARRLERNDAAALQRVGKLGQVATIARASTSGLRLPGPRNWITDSFCRGRAASNVPKSVSADITIRSSDAARSKMTRSSARWMRAPRHRDHSLHAIVITPTGAGSGPAERRRTSFYHRPFGRSRGQRGG